MITASVQCPSNIALVKYWGKYPGQIPANPSISYTLTHCHTQTEIRFFPKEEFSVQTWLSGEIQPKFSQKIHQYFERITSFLPWILGGRYEIRTQNTFPHSSGIASSASGFGAIAMALMQLDALQNGEKDWNRQTASCLARLGSGSACRSLYPGLVVWGETEMLAGSSDLYAIPYPNQEVHPVFRDFHDWVLLIHEGEKSVSSSLGHGLMNGHPYASTRFEEARQNILRMKSILKAGDLEAFIELVEHEALSLHGLMMMSSPAFILMQTSTLTCLQKIWTFRKDTGLPLFFTLDAGANVHLLFPETSHTPQIISFIKRELAPLTARGNIVEDRMKF